MFEGEGSFTLARTRRDGVEWAYLHLSMGMTDEDVVRRFQRIMGVGWIHVEKRETKGWKTMYVWTARSRSDVAVAVKILRPWLGERRAARLAEIEPQVTATRRRPGPRPQCAKGHPLTGRNAKPNGPGKVVCRRCQNERARARYQLSKNPTK